MSFDIDKFVDLVFRIADLKDERVALEADMRLLGRMGQNVCPVCAHYNHGAGNPEKCPRALKGEDCFEWRGIAKKEG